MKKECAAPFFSIVLPIYNVEKYLNRCIDSILKQGFDDYEIILVDDGSKDSCGQHCELWKAYQVEYNHHYPKTEYTLLEPHLILCFLHIQVQHFLYELFLFSCSLPTWMKKKRTS